jgi:phage tail-like protein
MPDTKDTIQSEYPLPAYNYKVAVAKDGNPEIMSFSEVSGLTLEYEPVSYSHGLSFLVGAKIIPGKRQAIRITLRRGVVKNRAYFQSWMKDVYSDPFSMSKKRDITIDLCDAAGTAIVRWTVQRAMPVKWEGPTFDASKNEVAIETMELVAHGLQANFNP